MNFFEFDQEVRIAAFGFLSTHNIAARLLLCGDAKETQAPNPKTLNRFTMILENLLQGRGLGGGNHRFFKAAVRKTKTAFVSIVQDSRIFEGDGYIKAPWKGDLPAKR